MRAFLRLAIGAAALLGACSRSEAPSVPDDLKQDLAKVGGGDVQLAGSSARRVDVVSAAERSERDLPAPKGPSLVRVASAHHGYRAAVPSARHTTTGDANALLERQRMVASSSRSCM